MPHHDLAIIGTGSGNSILDPRFADRDVAIIERDRFGGTCLNVGCIPTKMFVHTADLAAVPARSAKLDVDEQLTAVRWADIRDRIFGRIDPIAAGGREYRLEHADNANVTVYEGQARFDGERRLAVSLHSGGTPETVTADRIVLASGGRPRVPDVPGLAEVGFHTSDTVMRLESLPARMIIIGSGLVAAEFAHVFSSFGVDITMIARSGALLRREDTDISARYTELAAGGYVLVDQFQRTTADGIWALGDICSPHELKHLANHEARVVQQCVNTDPLPGAHPHRLLHPDEPIAADHRIVPHAVFTSPQIASVGLTEQEAVRRGVRFVTATQDYAGIAYGWAMEDTTGFAKLLADPSSGLLLGAHIIGPQASSLLQPVIQAMSVGLDARTMARSQYWIHPALPELVENALLNLPLGDCPCPT